MYKVDRKKYVAALLCVSVMGYVVGAPALDPDLDINSANALVEKEVRLLEQDLNGNGRWVPEEDMLLLSVMTREHLKLMPYGDLHYNDPFVKAEVRKVMAQFVAKRARQHAGNVTHHSRTIDNAAKTEGNEFMGLLQKNPLREGKKLYHYFGQHFENRVKDNVLNGTKYYY